VVPEVLREHRLRPAAVLLTHGHIDHTYAVTPVCAGGTAAYVHTDDRYRLSDALSLVNPGLLAALEQQFGRKATWTEPSTVVEVTDRESLTLAGLDLEVLHAPGHTEGSVMFGVEQLPEGVRAPEELDRTMITGDVLFAGSIGRTDLPGGSQDAMQRSLRDVVLPLPDSTLVLPGHGAATSRRRERATNPYLQGLGA
jgi:glyoxylase-like metal-dependent hydrolase (beta-lactamase superfamily II)